MQPDDDERQGGLTRAELHALSRCASLTPAELEAREKRRTSPR